MSLNPYNIDGGPSRLLDRHAGGFVFIDGMETTETLQCVGCGMQWEVRRGSGKLRSWCTDCDGPLCCEPGCVHTADQCVPFAKWEEESAKALGNWRPPVSENRIVVPAGVEVIT